VKIGLYKYREGIILWKHEFASNETDNFLLIYIQLMPMHTSKDLMSKKIVLLTAA